MQDLIYREIYFNTVLSKDSDFEIIFDASKVYVTQQELDEIIKQFREEFQGITEAKNITYDNSVSNINALNVQQAVDTLSEQIKFLSDTDTTEELNSLLVRTINSNPNTPLNELINTVASAARMAKIENLDTTISSRAPADTALSNAVWTNARAANLDRLSSGVPITSIPSVIKSVQRGVAQGEVNTGGSPTLTQINISAVNPAKCMLIIDNSVLSNVNGIAFGTYAVSFTSTSIGFYGNALVTARPFSWQVIEFI